MCLVCSKKMCSRFVQDNEIQLGIIWRKREREQNKGLCVVVAGYYFKHNFFFIYTKYFVRVHNDVGIKI